MVQLIKAVGVQGLVGSYRGGERLGPGVPTDGDPLDRGLVGERAAIGEWPVEDVPRLCGLYDGLLKIGGSIASSI